jgi:hypothetical protein
MSMNFTVDHNAKIQYPVPVKVPELKRKWKITAAIQYILAAAGILLFIASDITSVTHVIPNWIVIFEVCDFVIVVGTLQDRKDRLKYQMRYFMRNKKKCTVQSKLVLETEKS